MPVDSVHAVTGAERHRVNIHIQSQGFVVTDAMSELIEVKLASALMRHRSRVQHIDVRLGDENGPRGGVDKYCRMQVHLVDGTTVRGSEHDADLYAAIERASQTVSRSVAKHVERLSAAKRIGPGAGRREFEVEVQGESKAGHGWQGMSRGEHG